MADDELVMLLKFNGKEAKLNKKCIKLLETFEDELIPVCVIGKNCSQKEELFENLASINNEMELKPCSITIASSLIPKENSSAKVLLFYCNDIESIEKNKFICKELFSLMFLASSLFIVNIQKAISDQELNNLNSILHLSASLESQNKYSREIIFTECSPQLLFFISDAANIKEGSAKDYLDNELHKRKDDEDANLIRELFVKYFPERDCHYSNEKSVLNLIRTKLKKELNPKNIKGKLFNGPSLALFIQKWFDCILNNELPNFDNLWDSLVKADIERYKDISLDKYTENLKNIKKKGDTEELFNQLYSNKVEAVDDFNKMLRINPDTFNNNEYNNWYNKAKNDLESEIQSLEDKKIQEALSSGNSETEKICEEEYEAIRSKIENKEYNSKTSEMYLNDYEAFLLNYNKKAKGVDKLDVLVQFVSEEKEKFIKNFMDNLQQENEDKLKAIRGKYEASNKNKQKALEEYNKMNETAGENSKKNEDMNSLIEKKKREIKTLNAQLEKIEEQIKAAQAEGDYEDSGNNEDKDYEKSKEDEGNEDDKDE